MGTCSVSSFSCYKIRRYACAGVVHVMEKLFSEASLATMLLFCGNAFIGLVGIAMLLILDIISESDVSTCPTASHVSSTFGLANII